MVDEPIVLFRSGTRAAERNLPSGQHAAPNTGQAVYFDRRELQAILNIYGRMVADGEWRDYSIGTARDRVEFSVYRRSNDAALYRIEKRPKLGQKQAMYAVVAGTGIILKRGNDLAQVLRILERRAPAPVEA
jgi:hypothetical protein